MDALTESFEWSSALLERTRTRTSAAPEIFRIGPSLVHRRTGRVESPLGEHRLRAKELELIAHLYDHVTVTFTREELLQRVWNCHPDLLTRTVDQTVATLRKKIEVDPEQPRFLQTVFGIGYRLVL
jgi:DNA-binding response OmpR family regulator